MPKICYTPKTFSAQADGIIAHANQIIASYQQQGYDLTLRQLYYQFVSRDLFPETWQDATTGSTNNERSYKKLGDIISQARRAGRIDWDRIVDRTRFVRRPSSWNSPADIVASCAAQFDVDWWAQQTYRPEVWVEKDALVGVLEVACAPWHCPYFSCRGYASDSEVWAAGRRFKEYDRTGQTPIIFHLGDHDPSGIDMTRDILDRLELFAGTKVEVRRLALTIDQVHEHNPPPNPAKATDSRYADYQENFGGESWELDALSPTILAQLVADEMGTIIDQAEWDEATDRRDTARRQLLAVSNHWTQVVAAFPGD